MTEYNYGIAWGLYLVSALGFFLLMWPVLNWVSFRSLRRFLKAVLAVLLFTPAMTVPAERFMAPATLVLIYDSITGNTEGAIQAGMLLVLALLAVLGMLLLESLFRRLLQPSADE